MSNNNIRAFRYAHPEYNDMSDDDLLQGMHKQFYSDMPYDQFRTSMSGPEALGEAAANPDEGHARSAFGGAMDTLAKRQKGVDYGTGVADFGLRAGLSRMSSDEERAGYLDKNVGPGMWGQDTYGAHYLTPEGMDKLGLQHKGMPTAIDEHGPSWGDLADVAGEVPHAGAAVAAGMAMTGAGAIPALATLYVTGLATRAIDETVKAVQGYTRRSPEEIKTDMTGTGVANVFGEGLMRTLAPLGNRVLGPYTKTQVFSPRTGQVPTADPSRIAEAEDLFQQGYRPSIGVTTERPILGRFETMAEKVLGSRRERMNYDAASGDRYMMQEGVGGVSGLDKEDAGNLLQRSFKEIVGEARNRADTAMDTANKYLDQSLAALRSSIGPRNPQATEESRVALINAKSELSDAARERYGAIDDAFMNQPSVPTAEVKRRAGELINEYPESASGERAFMDPETRRFLSDVEGMPDVVTGRQAQVIRHTLWEAQHDPNILKSMSSRNSRELFNATNRAFDSAGDWMSYRDAMPWSQNMTEIRAAVKELRDTNDWYRESIKPFDNQAISQLTRELGKPGAVFPEKMLDYVMGDPVRIKQVREVLPFEQWRQLGRENFEGLISRSTDLNENVTSTGLYKTLLENKDNLAAIHGKNVADDILAYGKRWAAFGGKVDPGLLSGGQPIEDAIRLGVRKEQAAQAVEKNEYIRKWTGAQFEPSKAVDSLFLPNNERQVRFVRNIVGENTPKWQEFRKYAMERMLGSTSRKSEDGFGVEVAGEGLKKEIDRVGVSTIREIFGRDTADGLVELGDKIVKATSSNKAFSGGIVAANVALHPLKHLGKLVDLFTMRQIFTSPAGLKYLTRGFDAPLTRATAENMTRFVARAAFEANPEAFLDSVRNLAPEAE